MTDKDLRRLSRAELLDILYEQRKRYEDSLAENQALRQQLEDRTLRIASAGFHRRGSHSGKRRVRGCAGRR